MRGFWKMLTGQGERENRQARKSFWDAIPDAPGFDERDHPAAQSNSNEAMNYRRANAAHGLKSKFEHRKFASLQAARAAYERQVRNVNAADRMPFEDWLRAME